MTILLLVAALGLPPEGPDLPSPRELFELYRENFDAFRTLDVQWRRDHRYTKDWFLTQQKQIEELSARLAAVEDTSSDEYRSLHQQEAGQRQALAQNRLPGTMYQTFLTDRVRFMMRTAPPGWGVTHADDDWLMPDVAVTATSMPKHYDGFSLISYQGDPSLGFRNWAVQGGGTGYGQVWRRMNGGEAAYIPPLGVSNEPWGRQQRHPIDEFFKADPAAFRTIGRATIDGRDVVIIESRVEGGGPPTAEKKALGDRFREFHVVRAHLDPKRGALPLSIAWYTERLLEGNPLPKPKSWRPSRVLEVTEIAEVEGAGFYPTRGRERTYGVDPEHKGPGNTLAGLIAGNVVEVADVALAETIWHAAKVEGNGALAETFALPFPENAYYSNEITGYSGRVGDEHRDGSRFPWALCGAIVAGWVTYGVVALARRARARGQFPANPSPA